VIKAQEKPGKSYWRGRLCTYDPPCTS